MLLSGSAEELSGWRDQIETYLKDNLLLELKKRHIPQPVTNGINFLGYIIRKDYLLVRRRVVDNMRLKLRQYGSLLVKEDEFYRRYSFDEEVLDKLRATLASYLGHFKMANTHKLRESIWKRYFFLSQYFDFDVKTRKLVCKYKYPVGIRKTYRQYLFYRWRFKGDVVLFQVGRFFEFYSTRDEKIAGILGLTKMKKNKRGARYGFPVTALNKYLHKIRCLKRSVTVISERDRYFYEIKERVPVCRFEYKGSGG